MTCDVLSLEVPLVRSLGPDKSPADQQVLRHRPMLLVRMEVASEEGEDDD